MNKTLTNPTAKKINARTVAARARKLAKQERMAEFAAMAYGLKATEVEYEGTEEGERVRLTPSNRNEAKAFLTGRRAYDTAEVLEALGAGWLKYFVTAGYAVKHVVSGRDTGIFVITEKAAQSFGLPEFINGGMRACYARAA